MSLSEAIEEFHPKEGRWEGAEHLLNQLTAFALVINIFFPPLFCSSSITQTLCIYSRKEGDSTSFFSVYRITEYRSTAPSLHCERQRPSTALFSASKPLNFGFNADPNPNPDPASKNNANLCGSVSGSANPGFYYVVLHNSRSKDRTLSWNF